MAFRSKRRSAARSNLSNRRQIYSRGDFIPFKFISVSPASKWAATLKFDAIKPEFREIALNLPLKFS
ncbi:hypothetical protein [Campylobacter showae]|uniref:hypothetical protein n=1 Tax=Campylobacter showae TaxID=204 RepID=UPI003C702E12